MQIFIAENDEKLGPFTLFQVEEKIRDGLLPGNTLAWYEGLPKWERLEALPAFERYFQRMKEDAEKRMHREANDADAETPAESPTISRAPGRPWTRFWARQLDHFFFLCASLAGLMVLQKVAGVDLTYSRFVEDVFVFLFPLWFVLEAYFLSRWGTTPGKGMLGIRVLDEDGRLLSFPEALRRSFAVFVLGLGCMLLPFVLITEIFAYFSLRKRGVTFWDASGHFQVSHAPFHPRQLLFPIMAFVLLNLVLRDPMEEIVERQRAMIEHLMQGTTPPSREG